MIQSEVVREFEDVFRHAGQRFRVRAVAAPHEGTTWQGWIEFIPIDGGAACRTDRETVQPDRSAVAYWADGLESVYLDGAYDRAMKGQGKPPA